MKAFWSSALTLKQSSETSGGLLKAHISRPHLRVSGSVFLDGA